MNANELADALDTIGDKYLVILGDIEFKKAADFGRQQQAEIEALKKEKWLTEIDAKQQALKNIIDWLTMEHDTLACTSYPIRKAQEK